MTKTIRLTTSDVNLIRREVKKIAKRWSGSKKFKIEIGERFNTDGAYPNETAINMAIL